MAWIKGVNLLEEVVEIIERHISDSQSKTNIYYELLSTFEEYDAQDLESLVDISDTLDEVLEDVYGVVSDEINEDEEWDDGGRENFS